MLLRAVVSSVNDAPTSAARWRVVGGYLEFFFDSQPAVLDAIRLRELPGPPSEDDVRDACEVVTGSLGEPERRLVAHMMVGVATVDGRPEESTRDRVLSLADRIGVKPSTLGAIFAAVRDDEDTHERSDDRGEPAPPPCDEPAPDVERFEATDPWIVFDLAPTATPVEIRRRYLALVREHHPDRNARLGESFQRAADRRLRRINDAYRELQTTRAAAG